MVVDAGTGTDGSAIHYADFLKGDISFNVNVPSAPGGGDNRIIGVSSPNTLAYIRFAISGTLTCQTSDGTTTTNSSAITWEDSWTGSNIIFRIMWEAGTAKFYINGSWVYTVTDASVPSGPLSLYLFDNSSSAMTIGDINVRGTQSFVMTPKTSDSTSTATSGTITMTQSVTVTENVTVIIPDVVIPFVSGAMYDSVTVSENLTLYITELFDTLNETVTVTENVNLVIPLLFFSPYEEITVTPTVSNIGIIS
jgi:hypothetical protein